MKPFSRKLGFNVLVMLAILFSLFGTPSGVTPVLALRASMAVTVLNDADSGIGSLRAAIGLVALGGTITFDANYFTDPRTITLASALSIAKSLTIDATGVTSPTVSGNDAVRVFTIASGAVVNMTNLTISHGLIEGANGGGIYSAGTLTLTDSDVSNNVATAINWTGGNGGGIYIAPGGEFTVSGSAFRYETAAMRTGPFTGAPRGVSALSDRALSWRPQGLRLVQIP